jgi:hypothetical protein
VTQAESFESTKSSELERVLGTPAKKSSWCLAAACLIWICAAVNLQSIAAEEPSHVWRASWITSSDAPRKDECVLQSLRTPKTYFALL